MSIQQDIDAIGQITIVPTLLDVICRTTGMGFSAIARVTDEKWIACQVRDDISFGLQPGGELVLETTICHEIRQSGKEVVIDNVAMDEAFSNHATPAKYGFQSYISMPIIRKNGTFFGTLCAINPRPAKLKNPAVIGMFQLFADLISFHLNAIEELAFSEQKLQEERKIAELREQFIAILGHDLRNPAGAILMGSELLLQSKLDAESMEIANIIKNSSYRITGLINNMLDFARGRLGAGITVNRTNNEPLDKILNQVIVELQTLWPQRTIEANINLLQPVSFDGSRIAQLFSNLLNNAILYSKEDTPVIINASSNEEQFELSIINYGDPIPANSMAALFQPFYRGEDKSV